MFRQVGMILLAAVFVAGCSREVPEPPAEPPARQPEVNLRTADETELAEAIRGHQGEVVLVDFWATWCPPCVDLFPHTVQLHERLADRGLAVISVSFDDPASEPTVRRFLADKGAVFGNFLSPYGVGPKAFEAFDIEDGALPHLRVYDRAGKVHKTFGAATGGFTAADVERAVEELLGES